jgi:hypothetical protein
VGKTHIVVIIVRGGFFIGLLRFAGIVFTSKLGFSLPISCVSILGLLSHELENLWLAITLGDFVLKVIWKSFVKMMSEWGIVPVTARC